MVNIEHETVKHSVGKYVREQAHTNGIESFWSMLKCGYIGGYHRMSVKYLARYVAEIAPLDARIRDHINDARREAGIAPV